jgi:hypothetical protein
METLEKAHQSKVQRVFGSKLGFITYLGAVLLFLLVVIFIAIQAPAGRLDSRVLNGGITSLIIMLFVMHLCMFFRVKLKMHMPVYVDIYVLIGSFGHMAGLLLGWYDMGFGWDAILHATAGVLFGFIGFSFIPLFFGKKEVFSKKIINIPFAVMFAIGFSMFVAVFWEAFEFLIDTIYPTFNAQRWMDAPANLETQYRGSGLLDTMHDLLLHLGGTIIAAVAAVFIIKKRPNDARWLIYKNKDENKAEELD